MLNSLENIMMYSVSIGMYAIFYIIGIFLIKQGQKVNTDEQFKIKDPINYLVIGLYVLSAIRVCYDITSLMIWTMLFLVLTPLVYYSYHYQKILKYFTCYFIFLSYMMFVFYLPYYQEGYKVYSVIMYIAMMIMVILIGNMFLGKIIKPKYLFMLSLVGFWSTFNLNVFTSMVITMLMIYICVNFFKKYAMDSKKLRKYINNYEKLDIYTTILISIPIWIILNGASIWLSNPM